MQPPAIHKKISLLLSACCAVQGCAAFDSTQARRAPQPLPTAIATYYTYPQEAQATSIEPVAEHRRYTLQIVRFPFAHEGFTPTEPTVEFEWYQNKQPGKHPVIIVNPILGGDYPIEHSVCRAFANAGFHVAMPYRKTIKISPDQPVEHIELMLRQGIIRIRQIIDWVSVQPCVDAQRIGSFGISMGAIATVILAAVEPRIKVHVAALPGGSIADILTRSGDRMLSKPRKRYLEHNQLDLATLDTKLRAAIRTDPILLAPYIASERLTLMIALFDGTIGTANSLRLWRSLQRPRVSFIPFGHYTAIISLPYLKFLSIRTFKSRL
jgi:dienelactone hydrolase